LVSGNVSILCTLAWIFNKRDIACKAGFKGRSYHDEIVKSGRKPRKRGLKPWKGRGTFYKDHPMITCVHQKNGLTYFDVPIRQSLLVSVMDKKVHGCEQSTNIFKNIPVYS